MTALTNASRPLRTRPLAPFLLLVGALAFGACNRGAGEPYEEGEGAPAAAEGGESAADDDHEGEEVVVLDTTALRLGGIEVGTVESITTSGLPVTGAITYDADRVSHVGSRSDGRIIAVRADLGARVRRGQALAVLESVEVGQIRAEEREAEALLQIARENHAREIEADAIAHAKIAQLAGQRDQVIVMHPDDVVGLEQRQQGVGELLVDPAITLVPVRLDGGEV